MGAACDYRRRVASLALVCAAALQCVAADMLGLNSTAFGVQPSARAGALAAYLPGFGTTLLFGGSAAGSGQLLNDVWEYNSGLNRWARLSDGSGDAVPAARVGHAGAAVLGGSMLVLGGQGSNGVLGDAWLFQTAMQKWVQLTTSSPVFPVARTGHSAVVVNASTVLVFGGAGPDGSALTDIWAISLSPNSSTTTWTQLRASQPSGVTGGSCMRTKTAGVMAAAMLTAAVFFAA